jgi:hypothetical protein
MQRRVASIALAATDDSGFALAGSGAIREHGFTARPTADVDLFTDRRDAGGFERALGDVIAQLASEGFVVTVARRFELFARLRVTLDGEVVEVDLGADWRARQPVVLALGPVLDEYDAVSNKVAALFSRAEARDYLDVDAIRRSGRFSDAELLDGAAEHDDGFDRQLFAEALRQVRRIGSRRVREYGVTPAELAGVERRLTDWADQIEAAIGAER